MFYKVILYTYVCVRYSPVMVVLLTFDPLLDANILNDR